MDSLIGPHRAAIALIVLITSIALYQAAAFYHPLTPDSAYVLLAAEIIRGNAGLFGKALASAAVGALIRAPLRLLLLEIRQAERNRRLLRELELIVPAPSFQNAKRLLFEEGLPPWRAVWRTRENEVDALIADVPEDEDGELVMTDEERAAILTAAARYNPLFYDHWDGNGKEEARRAVATALLAMAEVQAVRVGAGWLLRRHPCLSGLDRAAAEHRYPVVPEDAVWAAGGIGRLHLLLHSVVLSGLLLSVAVLLLVRLAHAACRPLQMPYRWSDKAEHEPYDQRLAPEQRAYDYFRPRRVRRWLDVPAILVPAGPLLMMQAGVVWVAKRCGRRVVTVLYLALVMMLQSAAERLWWYTLETTAWVWFRYGRRVVGLPEVPLPLFLRHFSVLLLFLVVLERMGIMHTADAREFTWSLFKGCGRIRMKRWLILLRLELDFVHFWYAGLYSPGFLLVVEEEEGEEDEVV